MDDFHQDLVLQWYDLLERQLLDIMKDLPPVGHNLNSFSPRLAGLILDSCGLLDSILRQTTSDPVTIEGKSKPRRDLNIVDYAKLYAFTFELPTLRSIFLISPPSYLSPFENWSSLASGGDYHSPSWWSIHTDLKHDMIANLEQARLQVAIESLCALHQIVAVVPSFGKAVLRNGWVPGNKPSPEFTLEILEGKRTNYPILVEAKLFAAPRGEEKLPDKIEDFMPAYFHGSERLIDFFGHT